MITSRKELKECLRKDAVANKRNSIHRRIYADDIWKFIWLLRVNEYYSHVNGIKRLMLYPIILLRKFQFYRMSILLNYTIPLNIIGPGLSLAHPGTIVINGNCRIGNNCRIQTGVTLGSTNGNSEAPKLGNNIFLGDGCKLIGDITIADNVQIGANAVVIKDITEKSTTWGGVPARKISNNGSISNLAPAIQKEIMDGKN